MIEIIEIADTHPYWTLIGGSLTNDVELWIHTDPYKSHRIIKTDNFYILQFKYEEDLLAFKLRFDV